MRSALFYIIQNKNAIKTQIIAFMEDKQSIEQKTATAILESSEVTININGKEYTLGKPSVATIILAAQYVAELPEFSVRADSAEIVLSVMKYANKMKSLGKVLSVLILGAERVLQHRRVSIYSGQRKSLNSLLNRFFGKKDTMLEVDYLAEQILLSMNPVEMAGYISGRLIAQDINGFFVLTTSLKREGNILAPTNESEVESKTTQSGQQ